MFLNTFIRTLIRQGATAKLVRLLPNETTGASRLELVRAIMRHRRRKILSLWPLGAYSSGGFLLAAGLPFVAAGDSITAQGSFSATDTTTVQMLNTGYWTWAYNKAGNLFAPVGANAGVGGNTAAQLLTRYNTDVISKYPRLIFLLIGTNDLVSINRQASAILGDIDAMLVANRSIGAITVLGKVLPRGSIASPMTAPQIAQWVLLNAGIAARAASDVFVWDAESVVGNMDANHTLLPGYSLSEDFLHPNDLAAQKVGVIVANLIATIVAPGDGLFTVNDAVGNFCPNGFMTGTGGSAGSGSSGVVATGWAATGVIAGGATMVCSKVVRPAGGEWQQVALSGNYNGSGLASDVSRSFSMVASAGQKLTVEAAFEVDAAPTGLVSVSAVAQFSDGTSVECMASTAQAVVLPGSLSGVLRSMPCVATGSITSCTVRLRTYMLNVGGSTPVAIVSRHGAVGVKIVP